MAYGAPPPAYGPAPAPYGTPPPASPPPMAAPPPAPMPPPAPAKPAGVMLLAILTFVQGAILMAIAGYMIYIGLLAKALLGSFFGLGDLIAGICIGIGAILIIIGVIFFVLGWGLMNLKPWARKITMTLTIISVVLNILALLGGNYLALLEVIVGIVVIFYLTRPQIKAAFEPPMVVAAPMMMGPPPPMMAPPPAYPPQQYPPQQYPPQQAPPPGYPPQNPPPY